MALGRERPIENVLTVVFFVVALVPAIVLHEVSHGYVADRFGDHTARMAGRLSLNPIRHVDPFGTVILPGLLLLPHLFGRGQNPVFGYAKPVPINPANLSHPDRQTMWIALAGPATNLGLAIVGALGFRFVGAGAGEISRFLFIFVAVNVLLAVFNILPIPPLDGSKVLARYLPPRAREIYRSWEAYGALFMLVIFFLFPGAIFGIVDPIVTGLFGLLVGS
ncbi:MAG TPA: site-2 protease family protein [Actinomycetota bacterium]|nr:site-2 protease family protein [Actinomycetota bacterium]